MGDEWVLQMSRTATQEAGNVGKGEMSTITKSGLSDLLTAKKNPQVVVGTLPGTVIKVRCMDQIRGTHVHPNFTAVLIQNFFNRFIYLF